jgi:hypothetical protein
LAKEGLTAQPAGPPLLPLAGPLLLPPPELLPLPVPELLPPVPELLPLPVLLLVPLPDEPLSGLPEEPSLPPQLTDSAAISAAAQRVPVGRCSTTAHGRSALPPSNGSVPRGEAWARVATDRIARSRV